MMKLKVVPGAALPRLAIAGSALLLAMQAAAQAPESLSSVTGCELDDSTAFVCSTKELSNVVLQCGDEAGSIYVKWDDDAEAPDEDGQGGTLPIADALDPENPHAGTFACPEGDVLAVFVKSGSAFGSAAGLPRGSGALINLEACEDTTCANPDAEEDEGDEGDEGTDEISATGVSARDAALSRRPVR